MARDLEYQARQLIGKNYGVAKATTEKLLSNVKSITNFLVNQYGLQKIGDVKTKMVNAYFENMKSAGYAASTMQSHAAAWRTIAEAVGKRNIVPRTNAQLGVERADRYSPKIADTNKIESIRQALYEKSESLGVAHDMRQAFGLRAMESIRSSRVDTIDGKEYLRVDGAKGGRPRSMEIETEQQRVAIARVQAIATRQGTPSLIPADKTLKEFYNLQKNALHHLGATKAQNANMHTLRHDYAQRLAKSGVHDKQIAERLGHNREEVVKHYK